MRSAKDIQCEEELSKSMNDVFIEEYDNSKKEGVMNKGDKTKSSKHTLKDTVYLSLIEVQTVKINALKEALKREEQGFKDLLIAKRSGVNPLGGKK